MSDDYNDILIDVDWRFPAPKARKRHVPVERAENAEAAIARVRWLHREVEGPGFTYCEHCDHISDGIFGSCKWPCATIRALDGECDG